MMKVYEIRRKNLKLLTTICGSQRIYANYIGISPAHLNQLLHGRRNIGEKTARRIEEAVKLGELWLDTPHYEKFGELQ